VGPNIESGCSLNLIGQVVNQTVVKFKYAVALGAYEVVVSSIFKKNKAGSTSTLIHWTDVTEITEKVQGTVDRHPAYAIIPTAHS
jgi:hypothetical protein